MTMRVAAARPPSLLRGALFNLLGAALPALALLVVVPLVVQRLGAEGWGALALVGAIAGAFGLVDFNAGAASVKLLAERDAAGDADGAAEVVGGTLLLYGVPGLVAALALWAGAAPLVDGVLALPPSWRGEALAALQWSAPALLVAQLQMALAAVPQALQRYDLVGQSDAAFGLLAPLVTIAVVLGGGSLAAIVVARLAVALGQLAWLAGIARRLRPGLVPRWPRREGWRALLAFSAWASLQRVAAVAQAHADKLLVGAQLSLAALAAYAVPFTLASRLFGLLWRLAPQLFPLAAALAAVGRLDELERRYAYCLRYTAYLNACAAVGLALFAPELMRHWLGDALGAAAGPVLALVAATLFADSLTQLPTFVNDGLGRPHLSGLAALARAALGLAAAWLALAHGGLVAFAAAQFAAAALVAAGFLVVVHRRSLPWRFGALARRSLPPAGLVLALGVPLVVWRQGAAPLALPGFAAAVAAVLAVIALGGWFGVLLPAHRARLAGALRARLGARGVARAPLLDGAP